MEVRISKSSEAVKNWRKNTKERIVNAMGGECVCCGYNKCHEALDLHHIDPNTKDFGIGKIRGSPKNWNKIVEELKKCVLVCNRCHQELHHGFIELPQNYTTFNEDYIDYKKIGKYDNCPICGNEKPIKNITCSYECAAKKSRKVNWENIDLISLIENEKRTYISIAEELQISDMAVRKKYKKLKESNS